MQTRSRRFKPLLTLALVCAISTMAFADTIFLKDGTMVKGRITSFGGGKFVVTVGDGTRRKEMSFTADEVESIQFDRTSVPSTTASHTTEPAPSSNARYIPPPQSSKPIPKVITTDSTKVMPSDTPKASKSDTAKVPSPVRTTPTQSQPRNEPAATARPPVSGAKPIEIAVNVLADNTSNGWTNSGWVVKKGQKIRITGDGEISLGGGKKTGPGGSYEIDDSSKLLKSVPTGALIAVIGDDNNDFIYIGGNREFTATRDGSLFLGVNEGNLNDNSGKFSVKVEIDPVS
jgi:hypothetical protein